MSGPQLALARRLEIVEVDREDPVSFNDLPRVEIYTVRQVATILGIGPGLAYQLVRAGEIPAKRLGRRWVIPRGLFTAWLNNLPRGA